MSGDLGTVVLVPHTHWDREWYESFQDFRLRLVELLEDVVAQAEADPDFRFTIDGQMAAVDDYLAIRPGEPDSDLHPGGAGSTRGGAVAHLARRVPVISRDDRAQPRDRLAERVRAGRGDARRIPARHVRPLRPDAADGLTAPGAAPPDTPLATAVAGIAVSGTGVAVSVVRATEDGTQVRLVAMSQQPTTALVTGPFGSAVRTDLLRRPLENLSVDDGRLSVDLSPWEIVTIRLDG